jgi:N-acetylglucosaminyldiphosphoundecaprenol N-acetyl-beta-D-mannosaminyltransferase
MEQLHILGIKVTSATMPEIHREMDRLMDGPRPGVVLYANAHAVNLARTRPWLADFYRRADIVHCDGHGIILAARWQGHLIPERITWADWAWPLAGHLAAGGRSLFLLGGPEGLAQEAAATLQAQVQGLRIAGTHHGYFAKEGPESDAVVELINRSGADVLWLGLGQPVQERWLRDNLGRLQVKAAMICGAGFRYMAGWSKSCPTWMAGFGLEWLYHLLQEPKAKAARYLWGNPVFILFALLEAWGLYRPNRSKGST